jgi:hypothetical protein
MLHYTTMSIYVLRISPKLYHFQVLVSPFSSLDELFFNGYNFYQCCLVFYPQYIHSKLFHVFL